MDKHTALRIAIKAVTIYFEQNTSAKEALRIAKEDAINERDSNRDK